MAEIAFSEFCPRITRMSFTILGIFQPLREILATISNRWESNGLKGFVDLKSTRWPKRHFSLALSVIAIGPALTAPEVRTFQVPDRSFSPSTLPEAKMNKRDTFYYWYFIIHIPVTIIMDSTMVIPEVYQPSFQRWLAEFHITANKDFLLQEMPLRLQISATFELFVQLPIFFLAARALRRNCQKIYVLMTVYGFNAFFTTLLCLAYAYRDAPKHGLTAAETYNLLGLYTPYCLIPLVMMLDCGWRATQLIERPKTE